MRTFYTTVSISLTILLLINCNPQSDIQNDEVFEDFEKSDFGSWESTGNAFENGPHLEDEVFEKKRRWHIGHKGNRFLTSYIYNEDASSSHLSNDISGDNATGTLSSPTFIIKKNYISFLIGGGNHPKKTYIHLIINDKALRTATGRGSAHLTWRTWDVSDLKNQNARIEIGDLMKEDPEYPMAHINIDHIIFSDNPVISEVEIVFTVDKKYLIWPVKRLTMKETPSSRFFLDIDEHLETFMDVELADSPDFWVFTDLSDYKGKKLTLGAFLHKDHFEAFENVRMSDSIPGMDNVYREALRPRYHFSSKRGWLNDANGMMYYDGEWHMFYQHNPYNWHWWNVSWGHAVSTDMLHWKELPTAIPPGREGTIFSGSGAVDFCNTGGFKKGDEKTMILVYTASKYHSTSVTKGNTQCLSYSNDRGRTWTKYQGNPILPFKYQKNRDPKIFWHEPTRHWIMSVYDNTNNGQYILYNSKNLNTWTETGRYQAAGHECPDMFELPVDGDESVKKWIIWTANGNYRVGDFDGKVFVPETESMCSYYGDTYAGQTFSNAPGGRRVNIGWLRDHDAGHIGMPFNQQMSIPLELTLRNSSEGIRMFINPIEELKNIRDKTKSWEDLVLKQGDNPLTGTKGEYYEIEAEFDIQDAEEFGFILRGQTVKYTPGTNTLNCDGKEVIVSPENGVLKLRLFLDATSIEVIVNDGWYYISSFRVFDQSNQDISLFVKGGTVKLNSLKLHEMKSVW
jgi:fructan beta-fructosidase